MGACGGAAWGPCACGRRGGLSVRPLGRAGGRGRRPGPGSMRLDPARPGPARLTRRVAVSSQMWAEVLLLPCRAGLRLLPPLRLRHRAPGAMKLQSPQFQALFTPGLRSVAGECGPARPGPGGVRAWASAELSRGSESVPACCGVRRTKKAGLESQGGECRLCTLRPVPAVGAAPDPLTRETARGFCGPVAGAKGQPG